jgi:DNA gyrase subunit A
MVCVNKEDTSRNILVVSEKGFGKRTNIDEYRITNRGGKGVKTINVTEKTGSLVGILDVTGKEDLVITCKSGITIRTSTADIREAGRATQGVKLIRIDEGDEIAAISKIQEQEEAIALTETSIVAETEALEKIEEENDLGNTNESEDTTSDNDPETDDNQENNNN